ncbi:MAG: NAD(P)H-binding protein, partial [candidate division WOR-3 bacterium]
MQTILGSTGTIGNVLAKSLTQYTDKIRLVSRNPQKVNSSDETMAADVTDGEKTNKAVEGSEVVFLTV